MKSISVSLCFCLSAAALSACTGVRAPDFPQTWQPVNRFPEQTTEISLVRAAPYRAVKPDGTLKNLLARWAKEAGLTLVYAHTSDFTLVRDVENINTPFLDKALQQLNTVYEAQKLSIRLNNGQIVVKKIIDGAGVSNKNTAVKTNTGP